MSGYAIAVLTRIALDAEADRDAWKAKYEAAIDALRVFADCAEQIDAAEDDEEWAKFRLLVKDYRRAASLVSDHDRANSEMEKQG